MQTVKNLIQLFTPSWEQVFKTVRLQLKRIQSIQKDTVKDKLQGQAWLIQNKPISLTDKKRSKYNILETVLQLTKRIFQQEKARPTKKIQVF